MGIPGSVNDLENASNITIFPNPSKGVFNISLYADIRADYQITDALGRIIQTGKSSPRFNIDLSDQPAGLYLLSIPGVVSSRLVVN